MQLGGLKAQLFELRIGWDELNTPPSVKRISLSRPKRSTVSLITKQ
jgi:hypothetical protein